MKKLILIYDDKIKVPENIQTIIGNTSYGKIILKRKNLFTRLKEIIDEANLDIEILKISTKKEDILSLVDKMPEDITICHLFSNFVVKDSNNFKILLKKLPYINENYKIIQEKETVALAFTSIAEYKKFLNDYEKVISNIEDFINFESIEVDAFLDIANYNNFLSYISGGFDARFFNSLEGNEYEITKKSTNKKKIKQEYMYYHLLPDEMKKWMIMPYDYKETEKYAMYTMERLHTTDIAIRWTHKAINEEEFKSILKKAFYYITSRKEKEITKKEYEKIEEELYIKKVKDRITDLKKDELFSKFDMYIKSGTDFNSIDEIFEYYQSLYDKYSTNKKQKYIAVIGHGDLCFANMLYNKDADLLKLIDPKGALTEEELWTNPYYDVAKLSHSICGNYDFFNCSSYSIYLDSNLKFKLEVYHDNKIYKEIFKKYVEESGFDYKLVRLYEASLFLSMLPLHMDNPQKVFGFLLNAINILKEIDSNV